MVKRILLVEGIDDQHVMNRICESRGIPGFDEVTQLGGVEELLSHIPVRLLSNAAEDEIIAVVIDADEDLESRWQSVRDRFAEAEYDNLPGQPDPNGTIFNPPLGSWLPRAGVWLMPDNRTPGILEDFLRFLVPQPSALFDHAVASVDSIPNPLFRPVDEPKALLYTWLAWQETPGRPFGTALTAHFLDSGAPEVDRLVSWLERLFSQPAADG